jgi:hypothetical protein
MRFLGVLMATLIGFTAALASLWVGFLAMGAYRLDAEGSVLMFFATWAGSTLFAVFCVRFVIRLNRWYSSQP